VRFVRAALLTAILTLGCLLVVLAIWLAEVLILSLRGYEIRLCPLEAWFVAVALAGGIFIISYAINKIVEEVVKWER